MASCSLESCFLEEGFFYPHCLNVSGQQGESLALGHADKAQASCPASQADLLHHLEAGPEHMLWPPTCSIHKVWIASVLVPFGKMETRFVSSCFPANTVICCLFSISLELLLENHLIPDPFILLKKNGGGKVIVKKWMATKTTPFRKQISVWTGMEGWYWQPGGIQYTLTTHPYVELQANAAHAVGTRLQQQSTFVSKLGLRS